jgi:hypothetical protein
MVIFDSRTADVQKPSIKEGGIEAFRRYLDDER